MATNNKPVLSRGTGRDLICAVLSALLLPTVAAAADPEPSNAEYWGRVYQENHVLMVHFSVSRENWDRLATASRGLRQGQDTDYVRATVSIDGENLEDVGFRFKGNSSLRFAGNSPRKPFKVDTNRFVKGQKLAGVTKLNFSNAFKDPTYLREKMGYEVFRAAGVPTPGVGWARLTLSVDGLYENEPLGLYVLVEQVDEDLLVSRLGKASKDSLLMKPEMFAWQYLGEDPAAYEAYEIKEGGKQHDLIARLARLLRLLESAGDDEFETAVVDLLDLDNFASYLAANALLVNLDSFVGMPHNYYLLVDKADGKLKILPWDLNECFGVFSAGRSFDDLTRWDIDTPYVIEHRILLRLFQLETFRDKYLSAVQRLSEGAFSQERLFERMDELAAVVRPELEALYGQAGKEAHIQAVDGLGMLAESAPNRGPPVSALKPFVAERTRSVQSQLSGDTDGVVFQSFRRPTRPVLPRTPLQQSWEEVARAEAAGKHDEAIATLRKIAESTGSQEDGYINLRLGWLHYSKGDYPEAVVCYATAAVAMPKALSPRRGLLAAYQAQGDSEQVVATAEGILLLEAADYTANQALGDAYFAQANYTMAGRYYLRLVTLYPTDLTMATRLGWTYLRSGDLNRAATVFGNVLRVNPRHSSAQFGQQQLVRRRLMIRLLSVLDEDGDGDLSAEEMVGAPAALLKLDSDGDGTLSIEELQSTPPVPAGKEGQ